MTRKETDKALDRIADVGEPMINLHCSMCNTARSFRSESVELYNWSRRPRNVFYTNQRCEHCHHAMVWIQGD